MSCVGEMVGRSKGKVAERDVAALLADWWGSLEPGCSFIRTPLSGGWQSQAPTVRAEFRACGDIMTTARRFPWCIEVKRREGWAWHPLLAGKASPVLGWWVQAMRDASLAQLAPMLWFRRNREPWYVMLDAVPQGVARRHLKRLPSDTVLLPAVALLAVQPEVLLSKS